MNSIILTKFKTFIFRSQENWTWNKSKDWTRSLTTKKWRTSFNLGFIQTWNANMKNPKITFSGWWLKEIYQETLGVTRNEHKQECRLLIACFPASVSYSCFGFQPTQASVLQSQKVAETWVDDCDNINLTK